MRAGLLAGSARLGEFGAIPNIISVGRDRTKDRLWLPVPPATEAVAGEPFILQSCRADLGDSLSVQMALGNFRQLGIRGVLFLQGFAE